MQIWQDERLPEERNILLGCLNSIKNAPEESRHPTRRAAQPRLFIQHNDSHIPGSSLKPCSMISKSVRVPLHPIVALLLGAAPLNLRLLLLRKTQGQGPPAGPVKMREMCTQKLTN